MCWMLHYSSRAPWHHNQHSYFIPWRERGYQRLLPLRDSLVPQFGSWPDYNSVFIQVSSSSQVKEKNNSSTPQWRTLCLAIIATWDGVCPRDNGPRRAWRHRKLCRKRPRTPEPQYDEGKGGGVVNVSEVNMNMIDGIAAGNLIQCCFCRPQLGWHRAVSRKWKAK